MEEVRLEALCIDGHDMKKHCQEDIGHRCLVHGYGNLTRRAANRRRRTATRCTCVQTHLFRSFHRGAGTEEHPTLDVHKISTLAGITGPVARIMKHRRPAVAKQADVHSHVPTDLQRILLRLPRS